MTISKKDQSKRSKEFEEEEISVEIQEESNQETEKNENDSNFEDDQESNEVADMVEEDDKKSENHRKNKDEEVVNNDGEEVFDLERFNEHVKEHKRSTKKSPKSKRKIIDREDITIDIPPTLDEFQKSNVNTNFSQILSRGNKNEPTDFVFRNISYSVPNSNGFCKGESEKKILNNISGYVKAGQVLAILGASGAGKTTLLNILSGNTPGPIDPEEEKKKKKPTLGKYSGDIIINGHTISSNSQIKAVSNYVMQDDVFLNSMTVREAVQFSALCRLPDKMSRSEKEGLIDSIITELGLSKSANTQIGDSLKRGISGGERKRLNIACEVVPNPNILFLDEPTSGLDSFTAFNLVETLLSLAAAGRTVICTIHQPRANIFNLFDLVLVLAANGHVAYFGPPANAVSYFSKLNFQCPQFTNPADFLLDITAIDPRSKEAKESSLKNVQKIIQAYPDSASARNVNNTIEQIITSNHGPAPAKRRIFQTGMLLQYGLLAKRAFSNFFRSKGINLLNFAKTLFFAIVVGLLFLNLGDDQSAITDRSGILFFVIMHQSMESAFGILNSFPKEKAVFVKERNSGYYRVSPYYFTRSVAELPGELGFTIIFGTMVYWMTGLQPTAVKYLIFMGIILLATEVAISVGLFLSAAFQSVEASTSVATLFMVVSLMFGGFLINSSNIPVGFVWLQYCSFFVYAYQALMQNEFTGLPLTCTDAQRESGSCYTAGEDVLANMYKIGPQFENSYSLGSDAIALACFIIIFRLGGYIALRLSTRPVK